MLKALTNSEQVDAASFLARYPLSVGIGSVKHLDVMVLFDCYQGDMLRHQHHVRLHIVGAYMGGKHPDCFCIIIDQLEKGVLSFRESLCCVIKRFSQCTSRGPDAQHAPV